MNHATSDADAIMAYFPSQKSASLAEHKPQDRKALRQESPSKAPRKPWKGPNPKRQG